MINLSYLLESLIIHTANEYGDLEGYHEGERETIGQIKWDKEGYYWSIADLPLSVLAQDDEREVIGNIYENKDLL